MFYTAVDRDGSGQVQRIRAVTDDLITWPSSPTRCSKRPPLVREAADDNWQDQAWRDPWVFRETPDGPGTC